MYSIWRSLHNKFVFSYVAQKLPMSCFQDYFFQGNRTENTLARGIIRYFHKVRLSFITNTVAERINRISIVN